MRSEELSAGGADAVGPHGATVVRIDVSMPLFAGMPAFPGDPEFASDPLRRLERGDPYALAGLRLGSHAGTHVDAPRHFLPDGVSVDRLDLDVLCGPAVVLHVPGTAPAVGPEHLAGLPPRTERLLLRTSNSGRWTERLEFFPDYVGLTLDGARALRARGVRLVGIDALSVESDPTDRFPVHRELLAAGVPIVEGLLLGPAPAGRYEMSCLPLRLQDGDGAPARVVLDPR